jgi:HAUS augmin-like complex subunit 6 N-terminus
MDDKLSVERIWFSNTLLLGFDVAQNEKKYRIPFSHDMFKNPNVKGMEVVLHFLLSKLYPTRVTEV